MTYSNMNPNCPFKCNYGSPALSYWQKMWGRTRFPCGPYKYKYFPPTLWSKLVGGFSIIYLVLPLVFCCESVINFWPKVKLISISQWLCMLYMLRKFGSLEQNVSVHCNQQSNGYFRSSSITMIIWCWALVYHSMVSLSKTLVCLYLTQMIYNSLKWELNYFLPSNGIR